MRILLGRAGSGKTHTILREIATAVQDDPLGPPIVLIVPDQVTFYMEKELIKLVSRGAVARAQVMSFRRLAWRGLQAVGGLPLEPIRKAGKYALVAAVLQDVLPQLRALGRATLATAYIDRLMRLLEEFQAAGTTADQLRRLADDEGAPLPLRLKMADLALITDGYQKRIAGRFIDPHDLLPQFCARAQEWTMLVESTFYVDGFVGFTPQEYGVMQVLHGVSGSLTVALAMPAALAAAQSTGAGDARSSAWSAAQSTGAGDAQNSARSAVAGSGQSADGAETDVVQPSGAALHSPFAQAQDVYRRLAAGAKKAGVTPQLQTCESSGSTSRFAQAPRIAHLEQRLYTLGAAQWNAGPESWPEADLVVANAPTRRAEVDGVIAEIVRNRMTRGLRWRDCAIIVTDLAVYGPLIGDACTAAGVPYFMDERRSLKHHPLSEFVLSALRLCAEGFATGPLLRLLKTDLFPLSRQAVDELENHALAVGDDGPEWLAGESRDGQNAGPGLRVERGRLVIAAVLGPFYRACRAPDASVKSVATLVWQLLVRVKAAEKAAQWIVEASRAGELDEAAVHEQALKGTIAILDDMVSAFGESSMPLDRMADLFAHAFDGLSVGLIPAKLDQVIVTEVSRVRAIETDTAFVVGCTDGLFPQRSNEDELLTDSERDLLIDHAVPIAPASSTRQLHERYRVYMALTRARRKLTLSYPLGDEDGRALTASLLLSHIRALFGPGQTEEITWPEGPTGEMGKDVELCITPRHTAFHLASALREGRRIHTLAPLWQAVYDAFAMGRLEGRLARPLLRGLAPDTGSEPLERSVTRALFGEQIAGSVSRFERFAACPFAHFAEYGLRLRPRALLTIDQRTRGELVHETLHRYAARLKELDIPWAALDHPAALALLDDVFERVTEPFRSQVPVASARTERELGHMRRALVRAVGILTEHAHRSEFSLRLTEQSFEVNWPGPYPTVLRGRIDRIDSVQTGEGSWFRIIDYKSGERSVEVDRVYHGLSLQLFLYAQVVEQRSVELLGAPYAFAGLFYFPVTDPIVPVAAPTPLVQADVVNRTRVRMKGLLTRDPALAPLLDNLNVSGRTDLFPRFLKKDGSFDGRRLTVTRATWQRMSAHTARMVTDLTRRIHAGETAIAPYRHGGDRACDTCALQALCQFEPGVTGVYRNLPKLHPTAVWERLGDLQGDGEEHASE